METYTIDGEALNRIFANLPQNPFFAISGREPQTTFWQDFSIADVYGAEAVQDTYNRAFAEWRHNMDYLPEFVCALNHKIWQHHERAQEELRQAQAAQDFAAAYPEKRTIHKTAAAHHRRKAEAADNLARLYDRLWREANRWACDNLTGEDLDAYYAFTD